jgi:hypothetical protein
MCDAQSQFLATAVTVESDGVQEIARTPVGLNNYDHQSCYLNSAVQVTVKLFHLFV